MPKNNSISCTGQELKINIIKSKCENGEHHLTIKVVVDQTFVVKSGKSSIPDRHIQRLVTQELEIY